jgi:hypothetical protein
MKDETNEAAELIERYFERLLIHDVSLGAVVVNMRSLLSRALRAARELGRAERDAEVRELREVLVESNLRRCGMCGCFPIADEPHALNCLVHRALAQPPSEPPAAPTTKEPCLGVSSVAGPTHCEGCGEGK